MAELTHRERLQPSLLDRLTDESPESAAESRDRRVLSLQRLREVVRRDLSWLLNCVHMEASQDLSGLPLACSPASTSSSCKEGCDKPSWILSRGSCAAACGSKWNHRMPSWAANP